MKFSEIIDHLANRGFAYRKKWRSAVVVFGMDNQPQFYSLVDETSVFRDNDIDWVRKSTISCHCVRWKPNLDDFKADDWEILDKFWDDPVDDPNVNFFYKNKLVPLRNSDRRISR